MATGHGTHAKPEHAASHGSGESHYRHLMLMAGLSFIAMYALMYAMVNTFANVYTNVNQAYMAGLMAAPMVMIEIVVMRAMYRDRRLNAIVLGASVVVLVACWTLIRQQTAVGDSQFLRSMIPHHAGAILMCQQAPITNPRIHELCKEIMTSQQSEIDQMKAILAELDR